MLIRLHICFEKAGTFMNLLFVALGGFLGSIARFAISRKMNKRLLATWIANITGSMFLACLLKFYIEGMITSSTWHFLGIGFCGAYTTFSTFGNETLNLILEKKYRKACGYIFFSFFTSIMLVHAIISI